MAKKKETDIQKLIRVGKTAKTKMLGDLLARVARGQTMKTTELHLIRKLEQELGDIDTDANTESGIIYCSSQDTAKFFDISRRGLSLWVGAGCPKEARGRFNLKLVHNWWRENIQRENQEQDDDKLTVWRRLYWKSKSRREEIKLQEDMGSKIDLADVKHEWVSRILVFKSGMEAFVHRLPPLLEGRDRAEITETLRAEVREVLEGYSRDGRYCPKP